MGTLLAKVRRDLTRRPLRNLLTLIGIIVGVAGVVSISSSARLIADAQRTTYTESQQADLASFATGLSPTTRDLIERQPNVTAAETRSVTFTRFDSGVGWENVRLVGVESFDDLRLDVVELVSGRFPGRGEIAFDVSTREIAPVDIGSVVGLQDGPNDDVNYLTVVGLTRSPATLGAGLLNRATAYAPTDTVWGLTGRASDNFILVRVRDQERASQTSSDISQLLAKRGASVSGFDVRDPEVFVGSRELGTLLLLLSVFSYLGAALSSVLVANTLAAVVGEETSQIGVMKSLGGRRWQIVLTYLLYASILGALGTVVGWAAGVVLGREITAYLTNLTGLQEPRLGIAPREAGLALLVGTLVTLTASVIPVMFKANERVAPLLSAPGVRSDGTNRLLRWLTHPLARMNSAMVVGARNALRRPARTISTVIVVTVAVAAFVATQSLSRSVSETVDDLYALYGADAWVSFQQGVDRGLATDLELNPWVVQAEPWTSASGSIGTTRTDIWGMPARDTLYDYRLVEGRWFTMTDVRTAVVTSNLAAELGVRVGDVRQLDVGRQRETIHVVGIVNDSSTYLGNAATGKVFMNVSDVSRLRELGQRADIFALKFTSPDSAQVDLAMASIEEQLRPLGPVTYASYADQESSRQAINVLTLMLNAMVVVVGAVGMAGIINTLLINIAERRREFGVLRAIGAGSRDTIMVLVSEGVLLALIGLIAGVIVGYPLARLLVSITSQELFELTFQLSARSVATTFVVALGAVAAASAIPGLVAARIRPIQVLRYE